jgi:hypothetical protein
VTMHCEHPSGIFVLGSTEEEVREAGERLRARLDVNVQQNDGVRLTNIG